MVKRHSAISHAAYHDLLSALQDEAVSDIRGTPKKVERNGKAYWYDMYRIGSDVKNIYIGEDSDELSERLERHAQLKSEARERRAERVRLVQLLRAEGLMSVDAGTGSLLNAMASSGVFRLGGTLVGTNAFRLYDGELGVRFKLDETALTQDVDIASYERLSLALKDTVSPELEKVLSDFSFAPVPSLKQTSTWRWRQSRSNTQVEFLTPSFEDDEGIKHLKALGVDAQSLHHLNYLLAKPIKAAVIYRSGVLVQIPRPERFAIHKLIVADRRTDRLKSRKDLLQAQFLIEVLAEDRPDELEIAFNEATKLGSKWQDRISASLAKLPETQERLDTLR
ncbi:MAG: GSU2403 family nucleotidyltransferase fold protein [Phyllobacteriaceae bacterium]|nr:GSU2403 family nucleotidyltransferase fold protein [Phyllobacteriaceae bacterium]